MMGYNIFNAPYRQHMQVNYPICQTLRYSAVELFVYEEDEQINVHFGPPKHRHGCQALVLQLKEVLCVWRRKGSETLGTR